MTLLKQNADFFKGLLGLFWKNKQTNKKEQDKNLQLKLLGDLNFVLFLR